MVRPCGLLQQSSGRNWRPERLEAEAGAAPPSLAASPLLGLLAFEVAGGADLIPSLAGCVQAVGGRCEFLEVPLGHPTPTVTGTYLGVMPSFRRRVGGCSESDLGCSPVETWY